MGKPHIVIISPALANANNGNWQTASRWARFLRERYRVTLAADWDGAATSDAPDALIALHARRSARSLAAFADVYPALPAILVLTGTDLYRDIRHDADARHSLLAATRLVVLQEAGVQELDAHLRGKVSVIHQSARSLAAIAPRANARHLDVAMIGHLRAEKDPLTFMQAAALVTAPKVRLTHIGGALEPALGMQAEATQRAHARYRWLGHLSHAATRQHLRRSRLMVIASRMEGGANVIIEAVTSGVPVLASDIAGNRGMLGQDYAGYFPLGDAAALARMIDRTMTDPAFYARLQLQCEQRAPLFSPETEKAAVLQLVDNCILSRAGNRH